jgi:hypothetical protein
LLIISGTLCWLLYVSGVRKRRPHRIWTVRGQFQKLTHLDLKNGSVLRTRCSPARRTREKQGFEQRKWVRARLERRGSTRKKGVRRKQRRAVAPCSQSSAYGPDSDVARRPRSALTWRASVTTLAAQVIADSLWAGRLAEDTALSRRDVVARHEVRPLLET